MKKAAVGAAVLALLFLTACTPSDLQYIPLGAFSGSQHQGQEIRAQANTDDGGPHGFSTQILCTGESSWRTGNYINVDGASNLTVNGTPFWVSRVYCPAGRWVTGVNVWRH